MITPGSRSPPTPASRRPWLAALCALAAAGAWAAPAQAITFSQQTLPFSGLFGPAGAAVDGTGDVFVADPGNDRVVELPVGGAQATLPFTGLNIPQGVAVDGAGDVFDTDTSNGRVVELTPTVPSGSLAFSPGAGPAGSSIGVSSVTPCPMGGTFGSATARLSPASSAGTALATATAPLDAAGNWTGTLMVPASAASGSYLLRGRKMPHHYRAGR